MKKIDFDIKSLAKISKGCFICSNRIPQKDIIFENKEFVVFLDAYPTTKAYVLIGTKKHYTDITEMDEREYLDLQELIYRVSGAIKKDFHPQKFIIFKSGYLVAHLHFHLVPVYKGESGNMLDIILKKQILQMSAKERQSIVAQIKKQLKNPV